MVSASLKAQGWHLVNPSQRIAWWITVIRINKITLVTHLQVKLQQCIQRPFPVFAVQTECLAK